MNLQWRGFYIWLTSIPVPFNAILKIPAGKHLMDLVAVDWFKDSKRIDHVARRKGCAAQVRYLTPRLLFVNFLL